MLFESNRDRKKKERKVCAKKQTREKNKKVVSIRLASAMFVVLARVNSGCTCEFHLYNRACTMWKFSHTKEVPGLTVYLKNIMVKRN